MSPTPALKSGTTPSRRMCDPCIVGDCQHPRSGPRGGRLEAGLANFCHCHARWVMDAFPMPGDDRATIGVCDDGG